MPRIWMLQVLNHRRGMKVCKCCLIMTEKVSIFWRKFIFLISNLILFYFFLFQSSDMNLPMPGIWMQQVLNQRRDMKVCKSYLKKNELV